MSPKIYTLTFCIFILTTKFTEAAKLSEIIPDGYSIKDSVSGNLNNDQYNDLIMVLKRTDEDSLALINESTVKREMIILYGMANGYSVIARNMNAVYCVNCGGVMGDPYEGISIENQTITISHYGGSVERWGLVSTFSKNPVGTWILSKLENETFNAVDPNVKTETIITTPKDFGSITFEQYDIYKE